MNRGSYERTEDTKKKQREAMLQRKQRGLQPRGWKWSDESKMKASLAQKKRLENPEANPFFGKHHSESSKAKISKSRTGLDSTPEERRTRKARHTREWITANPERVREFDLKYLPRKTKHIRESRQERRRQILYKLGSRCASSSCRWLNEDGTLGCTDPRLLQIDHKNGGGTQERNKLSYDKMLRKVLEDCTGYQLLCASCNWLKAHEQKEFAKRKK